MYEELRKLADMGGDFGIRITKCDEGWEVMVSRDGMDLLPAFIVKTESGKRAVIQFINEYFGCAKFD